MKKYWFLLVFLLLAHGASAQDLAPTPSARHDFLDEIMAKADPETREIFKNTESTLKEFQKDVEKTIKPDGNLKDPVMGNYGIMGLDLLAVVLAEQHELRGLGPKAIVAKFGEPIQIRQVREFWMTFSELVTDHIPFETLKEEKAQCYEYDDLYVWLFLGKVTAITPRSRTYDNYLKNTNTFH